MSDVGVYRIPETPYGILKNDELGKAYDSHKKIAEQVCYEIAMDNAFHMFLEKVDATGAGTLIETLFGEDEYIDSPGNYWKERGEAEYSIFHHFYINAEQRQMLKLYAWYIANIGKALAWIFQKEKCGYCGEEKPFVATWALPEHGNTDEYMISVIVGTEVGIYKGKPVLEFPIERYVPVCRDCFGPIGDKFGKIEWEYNTGESEDN